MNLNLNDTSVQIHQRCERLLREAEITRLSRDSRMPQPGVTSRFMVRVGAILVASGSWLLARYETRTTPALLDRNAVTQS